MGKEYQEQVSAGASGFSQLEDKEWKTAAQFFGEDLLYAGMQRAGSPVWQSQSTSILRCGRLEEDFNFIMKDALWRVDS